MSLENAYESLKAIGFGEYEARVYCALLSQSPANGYQVSSRSGVPRAKVYETLNRLVVRGAAVRVETSNKDAKVYVAVDPKTLIDNLQDHMNTTYNQAQAELQRLQHEPDVIEFFWRVTTREDLVKRALDLVTSAEKTLHVALWGEEFDAVFNSLIQAAQRKVRMAVMLYSNHPGLIELQKRDAGAILHGKNKQQVVPELGRQFMLASDRNKCITGAIFEDGTMDGLFSMNRGLVSNTIDLVNHEIYVERMVHEVGIPIFKLYGEDLKGLNSFDRPGFARSQGNSAKGE
jgi:sugar-specific transcriptional regulator TrmB